MKRRNITSITLIALLCVSCSHYLDIKPYGRTIPKTVEEFSALIHTRLNSIDAGSDKYLVGNADQWMTWDAVCGDNFETCLTASGARSLATYVGDIIRQNQYSIYYQSLYEFIRDCNIVLNEMKESGTEEADKVRGTAYALRGVAYYQLLRMFCETPRMGELGIQLGLPLVTTFDMEEKPLRSTMQATIDQIESDLQKAISYHTNDKIYRFTEDVIKGYLARMYFWTRQWSKALPIAQDLLNKYPLLEGEAYKAMMTNAYELTGNQILKSYLAATATDNEALSGVSSTLQYRPVSLRFLSTFSEEEKTSDIRYSLWVNTQRQAKKVFFCGMRAAEFKLMEAECYYHMKQEDKALKSINELRKHRIGNYMDLTADRVPPLSDKEVIKTDAEDNALTPLMGFILQERRKELFLEGDRFFEQKRNGSPEYWTALNGLKYVTEKYMYTFPIPLHDLDLENGLIQNPGYKEIQNK